MKRKPSYAQTKTRKAIPIEKEQNDKEVFRAKTNKPINKEKNSTKRKTIH
jgi:hypothetical protein